MSASTTRSQTSKPPGFNLADVPVGQTLLLVGLAILLALFIAPVSQVVLDALIVINFAASFLLFFTAITIKAPLEFVTFPTLLLFSTALRLAISLAGAKLIFQDANAGRIIESFGHLIAGGNVVKGAVIYLMVFVVSFLVISKGSERAAEVGARFTLDAMPGKQMSIDADLRAGLINGDKARQMRADLGVESSLHGAMDGAMKFVKGDAIAGVIIVLISAVAGMAIGVGSLNMSWADAAAKYTVLSVGEGMVSQLASLIVSLAAATQITRIGGGSDTVGSLGGEIGRELGRHPQALTLTGFVLLVIGVLPGFPLIPFWSLALVLGFLAFNVLKRRTEEVQRAGVPMPGLKRDGARETPHFGAPVAQDRAIVLRLENSLAKEIDASRLNFALTKSRNALKLRLGVPFPGLHLEFGTDLPSRGYLLLSGDAVLSSGICPITNEVTPPSLVGWSDIVLFNGDEPKLGSRWSLEWHLSSKIISGIASNSQRFVGVQETQDLLNALSVNSPDLVQELLREVPLTRVAEAFRRLVGEGISISPVRDIAESLLYWCLREQDIIAIVELVRIDLGSHTAHRWMDSDGSIAAIVLDPELEAEIRDNVGQNALGVYLSLDPDRCAVIGNCLIEAVRRNTVANPQKRFVVICGYEIRRHVSKLIEKHEKGVPVLSFQEISDFAVIESSEIVRV
jgi:type III secretion protein V